MIESIAVASSSAGALQYLIDRAGQAAGPSSLDASTDLDQELADFNLPDAVLASLRAPFEQLGFSLEPGTLDLEAQLKTPPSYTAAKRPDVELALIQLPDFLFGPTTTATVFIGNGIGYTFEAGARLHLFADGKDEPTKSLDKAMKSWVRGGVTAVFHPWNVIAEFDAATDRKQFVMRVFEVHEASQNGGGAAVVVEFGTEHRNVLHAALAKAFPTYEALELLLSLNVDGRQIADIVPPTGVPIAVLKIIKAAEAEGWIPALIQGARARNPGSTVLQAAAAAIPAALGGEGP